MYYICYAYYVPYSVVFDCVSVPDRQRVIVASGFRVPYQKGPVLILNKNFYYYPDKVFRATIKSKAHFYFLTKKRCKKVKNAIMFEIRTLSSP